VIAIPGRNVARVVRHGPHAMGKVSIWAQWLIITAGVLLSPVFVFLMACLPVARRQSYQGPGYSRCSAISSLVNSITGFASLSWISSHRA
jgi:hypothetical protein